MIAEVEESNLDPYPFLALSECYEEKFVLRAIALVNEGWGEVENASIKFNLVTIEDAPVFNGVYEHEIKIGNFSNASKADFSDALKKMGVEINNLPTKAPAGGRNMESVILRRMAEDRLDLASGIRNVGEEGEKVYNNVLRMIESLGPFKNSKDGRRYLALAYGEVSFTGLTSEGESKSSTLRFSTEVPLLYGVGGGGFGPTTYQYSAKLDADRENYRVVVQGDGSSVSQYIKAGETDRFNILMEAEKSTSLAFRLRFVYNHNQSFLSPLIKLKIFIPRSTTKKIKSVEEI